MAAERLTLWSKTLLSRCQHKSSSIRRQSSFHPVLNTLSSKSHGNPKSLLRRIPASTASCISHLHHGQAHGQDHALKERPRGEAPLGGKEVIVRSPYPDLVIPDDVSIAHLILNALPKYGDATAIVNGVTGQEMTYSQLRTSVVKVTSALVKLGLRKGDVVTVFSPNCPQFIVTTLAVAAAGAVFSPVNPVSTAGELKTALSHVGSKFLVTVPGLMPVAKAAADQCPHVQEIIVFGEADKCRPFSSLLDDDMTSFPENLDFRPMHDVVALPFSSGTTGLPKAVMLSHYNLVSNVFQNGEKDTMGYSSGSDCLLAVLPFFHIYGQMLVMFSGLSCGTKIVTLPNFQPGSFLESIQKYHPTYLHVVPPLMLFLARHPHVLKFDLSSVRNVFVGAAPTPVNVTLELLDRFKDQLVVRQGYGLTEASPLTHCNGLKGNKYHTIGPAVNNTTFKVVDMETRESLGPGQSGELCIRGPQVMIGYYGNEKATAETLVDGWLLTGDVSRYDEDGHVIVEDRIKELIKVKGLQVAPAELEAVLVGHPCVQEAAVIGIKDERNGEAPKAFVVLKPEAKVTAEELKQHVAEKVAPYKKLVGGIEFRTEIPKSASGKILRRILKAEVNPN